MALTVEQRDALRRINDFLEKIRQKCPNIGRIDQVVPKLGTNLEVGFFVFDTAAVEAVDKSAPAFTKNKKTIYIREDFILPGGIDITTPSGMNAFVSLMGTVIHEIFHQLCSSHPTTYFETETFLRELLECVKKHSSQLIADFGLSNRIFDLLVDLILIQADAERAAGIKEGGTPPPLPTTTTTTTTTVTSGGTASTTTTTTTTGGPGSGAGSGPTPPPKPPPVLIPCQNPPVEVLVAQGLKDGEGSSTNKNRAIDFAKSSAAARARREGESHRGEFGCVPPCKPDFRVEIEKPWESDPQNWLPDVNEHDDGAGNTQYEATIAARWKLFLTCK